MKITGVIAEYNPFHNGHRYHLEQTRAISGADYIIAVISGDFMQRGVPALIHKYARTEMALQNGADLVLELPAVYAAGSAEFFAMGAVSLLDRLGSVDSLCFGSECGSLKPLSRIASVLLKEPEEYRSALQKELKKGHSFPKARSIALQNFLPGRPDDIDLTSPNNILGIEYIKALFKRNSPIIPLTLQRQGSGYHESALNGSNDSMSFSSASAIRDSIGSCSGLSGIRRHVPPSVFQLLQASYGKSFPVNSGDFSLMLKYRLLLEKENGFAHYQDVTTSLSGKIKKHLYDYENFEQFCSLLKSREITHSRISRCLTHILLGITSEKTEKYTEKDYVFYARILGFRREAAPLFGILKANASLPLISKLADASPLLDETGLSMLEDDIRSAHIYDSVACHKFQASFINEYSRQLVIL
ncbi:hypothetical protein C807_00822 [Lachnospiraceae bacterium 28-4]|nr:hypothetical protein C807_00822 [Lachnospiraceae bacterium 28-4]